MNLSGPVGQGGMNLAPDVLRIQKALNIARDQDGLSEIAEDGIIGPETIAAILEFQRLHTQVGDGRIDPHGVTLRELEKIAVPIVGARMRSAILTILGGLESELQSRGLRLSDEIQSDLDSIEQAVMLLPGGAGPSDVQPAIYYPDLQRPVFQLAFAQAAPLVAAGAAEALLLALLAVIALLIVIQMAPAMGRALEDLLRQIQILMSKLIDKVKEAIREVEELVKRNSRAGMRCSSELLLFRQLSQQLLDLLVAPRPPDELGRRRLMKQLADLFEKWQKALQALLACMEANGAI
jgi:hypothetical protein